MRSPRPDADLATALGGLLPIAVAAVLVPLRVHMASANLALILMATVVLAAAVGGRQAGVIAAATATLSFDFFLTRPYQSLTIDSADDVETVVVLLLTGLLVGGVAGRRWAAQAQAAVSHEEIGRLHRVADLVAKGAQPAEVLAVCECELRGLLRLDHCEFEAGSAASDLPRLERNGTVTGGSLRFVDGEFALRHLQSTSRFCIEATVWARSFSPDARMLVSRSSSACVAVAIADQAGAALAPGQTVEGGAV